MLRIISKHWTAGRAAAALTLVLLLTPNCRQTHLVRSQNPSARNAYRPASPGNLSSYIRTALRISAEKGPQVERQLKQAQEQNPELARQADEYAARPADLESGLRLADSYLRAGLYFPAYEVYQRLRAATEPRVEIELGLAGIWDQWQDYSLARTHVEYALEINPLSYEAWKLLGRIDLHRGDFLQAAVSLEKALSLQASDAFLPANAGYAYLRLGRLEEAQVYLEKALSLDGAIAEAHNHLGIVFASRGDYDAALAHFLQTGEPAVALNNLGAVCLEQGKWEEARKYLREALSLKPGYEKALAHLRAADAFASADTRLSAGKDCPAQHAEPPSGGAASGEDLPPPHRVTVSIAPRVATASSSSQTLRLETAPAETGAVPATGNIVLGKGPYLIEPPVGPVAPAPLPVSDDQLYRPLLPGQIRSVVERLTPPLPSQAPDRPSGPVAPAPSGPGATLNVAALRWQEPLLDLHASAQTSLDWSSSPHSDQSSRFYVPSLVDILLTWFLPAGMLLGLLLAGGAGGVISMAAMFLMVASRLIIAAPAA
ncbi:MAG: tetratricopeptide repeat protein [Acidobacteriota bacterium]